MLIIHDSFSFEFTTCKSIIRRFINTFFNGFVKNQNDVQNVSNRKKQKFEASSKKSKSTVPVGIATNTVNDTINDVLSSTSVVDTIDDTINNVLSMECTAYEECTISTTVDDMIKFCK
jgi:hypothetical protein